MLSTKPGLQVEGCQKDLEFNPYAQDAGTTALDSHKSAAVSS